MNKKEFYIGWKEEMSDSNAQFLKKRLLPLFIIIPILVILFVIFQRPFNNHLFEFGNISEVTGTYYNNPFPMLIADEGALAEGLSNDILLVGFGKFGALGTMQTIQEKHGDLNGKEITLSGTLIHGDGKTLMELTEEDASFVKIEEAPSHSTPTPTSLTPITLRGEILDPKCYFGVMKPAIGKIHKSCAIRCISGGIPPVFRHATGDTANPYDYYLLVNEKGQAMNQKVLPFVAESISISGKTSQFSNWKVLYADINNFKYQ